MNCKTLPFSVVPGLDPGIHHTSSAQAARADPRVKPEGDSDKQLVFKSAYEEAS
jgi:hypothetical protein